jgi:hypothetical protein
LTPDYNPPYSRLWFAPGNEGLNYQEHGADRAVWHAYDWNADPTQST